MPSVSNKNYTVTPLAAGATYAGVWETLRENYVMVTIYADQAGTLVLHYRRDDKSTVEQETVSIPASVHTRTVRFTGKRDFRLEYTNNGSAANTVLEVAAHDGDYAGGLVTRTTFNHDTHFDAFGRLRVSDPQTLFDSQLQYDKMDLVWNEKAATGGTVVHDADGSFADLNTTTTSGSSVIRQPPYQRYQPGKSQLILLTYDPVATVANCRQRVGYFDDANGVFVEYDGSGVSLVLRSGVTGSAVDNIVAQADWSADIHDGTGPSGAVLDATKSQIFWADLEWLAVGTVRCGFFHGGIPYLAHQFDHSNLINKSYMTTANLPVRYEITNTGTTATAGKLRQICCSVISEGGFTEDFGFKFAAGNKTTPIAVTTRRAILSIRPKATFNSIVNRGFILPVDFGFFPQTNPGFLEVVYNAILGGTPSWNSVDADSICEFDVAGTTVTGGITLEHSHADAGGQGNNTFSDRASGDLGARYPLQLDIDGANPTILSLVVTSMTGTCDAVGHLGWKEIR